MSVQAGRLRINLPEGTIIDPKIGEPYASRIAGLHDRDERVVAAAVEWLAARRATLAEPVPVVRKSGSFAAALNRLANAEDALAKAITATEGDENERRSSVREEP